MGEVVHLVYEDRDEQPADQRDGDERKDEDDAGRGPPATESSLEPVDGRIQRQGEKERDEDPGQHVPGHPENPERDER